jgi:hypothetical protein
MREKTKQSLVVKAFIKSNKRDDIIEIKPNKKAIKTCLDRGLWQLFWHKNLAELTKQICLKSSQFLPTVLGVYNFLQCPSEDNITP